MRNALFVAVATTLFFTVVAVGQQENLLIDLRVEPQRTERHSNLYEAAATNDFPRFVSLYRAQPLPEYEELNRLWTWSMEDPIGAFYGAERYERLARLYPGYASYIDQYRIIDSNGNAFYPSAETRLFLLREAVLGMTPAPRQPAIRVAEALPVAATVVTAPTVSVASENGPGVDVATATLTPLNVAATVPNVVAPAPARSFSSVLTTPPIQDARRTPAVPTVASTAEPEPVRGFVRRNEANRGALSRSILLIIAGLIGVGMLSVMLHAPADEDRNFTSHTP